MENIIEKNCYYKHFKGNIYYVLGFATNTESLEKMVIYYDTKKPEKVWARPYEMFASPVDKNKYPDASQTFRFEKIDTKKE